MSTKPKPPRRRLIRPIIAVELHGSTVPADITVRPGEGIVDVAIEHGYKALGYRLTPRQARDLAELLTEGATAAEWYPSPED